MPVKFKYCFLHIVFFISLWCNAQDAFIHHWTTKDGLPHNFIYHLKEDNNVLWIGTDDGLSIFNGHSFKTYSTKDGLKSPYVIGFNRNYSDSLFLFTWKGGIHVFNTEQDSIHTYPYLQHKAANKLHKGIVLSDDVYGWQWSYIYHFNTNTKKGYKLSPYSKQENGKKELFFSVNKPVPHYIIKKTTLVPINLVRFQNKILVMGYDTQGLKVLEGNKVTDDFFENALGDIVLSCANQAKDGGLIVGTMGKIIKLSPRGIIQDTFDFDPAFYASDVYELSTGDMVASINKTMDHQKNILIKKKSKKIIELEKLVKSKSSSSSLLVDKKDRIWVSTQGDGLFLIHNTECRYIGIEDLSIPHILSINEKNDSTILFSTTNQVYEYNTNEEELKIKYPAKRAIVNIFEDKSIAFTSNNGSIFESGDSIDIQYSKYVGRNYGGRWFIEEDTLKVFDQKNKIIKAFHKFPEGKITQPKISQAIISDSSLWIATKGALSYYDYSPNYKLTSVNVWIEQLASGERINDILLDPQDTLLWVATNYSLYTLDANRPKEALLQKISSMENTNCTKLYKDHFGQLWVGTSNGLSVLRNGNLKRRYNKSSGLISNYITEIFESSDHNLWIGTHQGIMSMPNNKIALPIAPPTVHWKDKVYKSHSKYSTIQLPLVANSLSEMESIRLQYKIGKAGDWINFTYTDRLNITNKSPGEYPLFLRGKTIGSEWSKPSKSALIINGYFWESNIFKVSIILILLSGIIYYSNIKIKEEKLKSDKLKEIIRSRAETQKKLARIRKEIAQDFHDEMGNKLASITVLADLASMKLKGKDADTEKILLRIEGQSKSLYNGTRDFIWSIDAKNDELGMIYDYIKDFGEEFFDELEIRYHSKKNISHNTEQLTLPHSWSLQLVLIFKEAMTNIAKYAQAKHVYLSIIESDDDMIRIEVKDDGLGFDIPDKSKGNGLKNMKSRAKKITGSSFDIESEEGKGTSVFITFSRKFGNYE
ncbi:sensor histidine kinase [Flammeovirga agarivorans]|uniref:histidine kinase n=1 Tax=Flammeovirga agarivorans TaxID=2726742 RepID=A0A7X8XVH3_9BACT|nr:two-component regulator propeller domain-containing protein [Flammeovirga agarivorans]NLR91249.1 hypothetical protein [Flammeovirga agarivorans]